MYTDHIPKINPNSPEWGTKEYYDLWYGQGKVKRAVMGISTEKMASIEKAITPWDPPASPYDEWFDAAFSAEVESYVIRGSKVFQLLPKDTFQRLGDSWKFYQTDVDGVTGVDGGSTPFASGSVESGPDYETVKQFKPAYIVDPWETDFTSTIEQEWQPFPNNNVATLKAYHMRKFPNALDVMLTLDVDALANDGSSNLNIESIDRICSNGTESGDGTTYVSAVTDGDIYWGNSSALIDRSESAYAWSDAQVSLPSSAAARTLDLGFIDDVLADALDYADTENYIMITGARTINEMNDIIGDKQRFLDAPMNVQITRNGVETRRGTTGGFSVSSFISNGIQIPVFNCKHVRGENGSNITTKITDEDIGCIYLLNLDDIHIRVAVPTVYWQTPPAAKLTGDIMKDRHMLLYGAQLICTNFTTQAAVKGLKAA